MGDSGFKPSKLTAGSLPRIVIFLEGIPIDGLPFMILCHVEKNIMMPFGPIYDKKASGDYFFSYRSSSPDSTKYLFKNL